MAFMKNEPTKYVTVESNGIITELGGISGPIINPCKVPISAIKKMILNRKKVYEVNPYNTSEKIVLTLKTAATENFVKHVVKTAKVAATPAKPVETKVEEKKAPKSDFTKK